MNHKESFSILELHGTVTPDDIKLAYRKACAKYHPDRNPAGLEMMKLINIAYETVKDFSGIAEKEEGRNLSDEYNDALNAIINLGLKVEICGSWVWVTGDTKTHRSALKAAHFMWAPKKEAWYFRTSKNRSFNRGKWSLDQIRETYGSEEFKNKQRQIAA